jgi:hypothetical protein
MLVIRVTAIIASQAQKLKSEPLCRNLCRANQPDCLSLKSHSPAVGLSTISIPGFQDKFRLDLFDLAHVLIPHLRLSGDLDSSPSAIFQAGETSRRA